MLLMIVALPAVVAAVNCVVPPVLLVMLAVPAVAVSVPTMGTPKFVVPPLLLTMVALPAVLWSWKLVVPPVLLVIVAFIAEVWARKLVVAVLLLMMCAVPALLVSVPPSVPKNSWPPLPGVELLVSLVMVALPAVLAARN